MRSRSPPPPREVLAEAVEVAARARRTKWAAAVATARTAAGGITPGVAGAPA